MRKQMRRSAIFVAILAVALSTYLFAKEDSTSSTTPYSARNYSHLIGMPGFSDDALNMHFKLYQGYVKNANLLLSKIADLRNQGEQSSIYFAEIKRRLGWEFDGMRLHEDYFENLGGHGTKLNSTSPLYKRIVEDFSSYEAWKKDFIATGAMRGIGWAILYEDPHTGRLINMWINEHDRGHLAGGTPLLIMDVFEHAYLVDYGLDRKAYIDAFFQNIDWPIVEKRFEHGSH